MNVKCVDGCQMPELWEGVLAEGREMDDYRVSKELAGDRPVN